MLYPKDIESKLGFDKIRYQLKQKCASTLGESIVDKMRFSSHFEVVRKLLFQTSEFQATLISGDFISKGEFLDVNDVLKKSATEGAFCDESDLINLSKSILAIYSSYEFFKKNKEEYPQLFELGLSVDISLVLHDLILEKIDHDGRVKDTASKNLEEIRIGLRTKYNQVKKSLQSIFKSSMKEGFVPEGASITIRDGRMVIPILAEYKRRVPGFVHDESASGGTVYLEPTSVLDGNNEIRELEYAEKREIVKILTQITDQIRAYLPELKLGMSYLAKLDFIRAKAKLSIEYGAIVPKLIKDAQLEWYEAKHPLLVQSLKKENKAMVPLSISLHGSSRILIISGPNAGGKSVSLKTVGLLQYMLQSGLPIPVQEQAKAGIFEDILIDIGDEQSLENDLSTYSSHLKGMKFFLENASRNSLCLIDEFGTGTDPQFGGAIAQSVLKELNDKGAFGVITTHYSNIKHFAEDSEGLVNGAMRFDMKNLEPLFKLDIGKPGSSFSLEIAKKTGLPNELIDYAKSLIGDQNIDLDDLLNQLEKQKQQIATRDEHLKQRENDVKKLEANYTSLLNQLDENKKVIINKAKEEAARLLKDTNREIEKTIRHIKSNKAQKTETKKARERLEELKGKVIKPKTEPPSTNNINAKEIKVGDAVKIEGQEVIGTILSLRGSDAEVQIGLLKSKIKMSRLTKISNGQAKSIRKEKAGGTHGLNLTNKLSEFNTTLDVRGKRAEEVQSQLDRFLDDAILFGLNEIKVLHGKGNGVLREVVRNYAKTQQNIEAVADEHIERGGSGISVITLK